MQSCGLHDPSLQLQLCDECPPRPWLPLQVIAKCETRQSLFNFRALVDAADAIIMSRGNLGLDVVRPRPHTPLLHSPVY